MKHHIDFPEKFHSFVPATSLHLQGFLHQHDKCIKHRLHLLICNDIYFSGIADLMRLFGMFSIINTHPVD